MHILHSAKTAVLIAMTISVIVVAVGASASTSQSGAYSIPVMPAYFVRAWTGTDDLVHLLESTDGTTWIRPRTLPGPASTDGAAVAFDSDRTWLVAWNAAGSVNYVTGIGGPETPASGITWFAGSSTRLPTRVSVAGTPTVAFGNGKFVAVLEDSAGMLSIVPSVFPRPAMETDVPLGFAGSVPHLAYGKGRFVLAYLSGHDLVARTSVDGTCWSDPVTIFAPTTIPQPEGVMLPNPVSLSFSAGHFYAVGYMTRRFEPTDSQIIATNLAVYESLDGVSWRTLMDQGPVVDNAAGIPGAAFAACGLPLAYATGLFAPNVGNQRATPDFCTAPTSVSFGALSTVSGAATAKQFTKMALTFSEGRGPYLESNGRLSAPSSLGFGTIAVNSTASRGLTIRNTSAVPISVKVPASTSGAFRWGSFNGNIACGASQTVLIDFTPTSNTAFSKQLNFTSSTASSPHSVRLTGRGRDDVEPF